MAITPPDFTALYKPYALYLPSLQKSYAQFPLRALRTGGPSKLNPADLDFLSGSSVYWTNKAVLYSAGQFTKATIDPADIVSRNSGSGTLVVGDSGGYQVAKGTLPSVKHLERLRRNPQAVVKAWKQDVRPVDTILRWLDLNCDYAMTLDMPLWLLRDERSSSPFAKLSEAELLDLSLFNLQYFADNRGRATGKRTKLLNVLHDIGDGSGDRWYKAVTGFEFEGWAFGSDTAKDLHSILHWLKRLLNDGKLNRTEMIHIFKASPPLKSVWCTAIQQRLRALLGTEIRVSYDSSSPFQNGGRYEQYALKPALTNDIRTWSIPSKPFPQGPQYVGAAKPTFIPNPASPLLAKFSVDDLHQVRGDFAQKYLTQAGQQILINHNLYVYHAAAIEACDLVFDQAKRDPSRIPQQLQDDLNLIERTLC